MRCRNLLLFPSLLSILSTTAVRGEEPVFQTLFNGEDLSGWKGLDAHWSVREGHIVGQTTDDGQVLTGLVVTDFGSDHRFGHDSDEC